MKLQACLKAVSASNQRIKKRIVNGVWQGYPAIYCSLEADYEEIYR